MIEDPLALAAVIAGVAALGFWLEGRFAWARQVGASLLIIFSGAVLSNLDLVAAASPVYGAISGPVTSLAIVWLLLAVDLRDLRSAGPRMLAAFALAVTATCAGAFSAALAFGGAFGGEVWKLGAVMTGTYAGGSLNFVAVGREVGLEGALFTAAAASDNVLTAVWMGATLVLPLWLRRFYRARRHDAPGSDKAGAVSPEEPQAAPSLLAEMRLKPFDLVALLALGLFLILASEAIAARLPGVAVLWLTTLALAAGQVPAVRRLAGSLQLGMVALNLFFAVIGIASKVSEILAVGLEVFYFTAVVILVHGLLTYGGAWLLRLDVETTSVASQAAVGGPSTAMALAAARGWRELALPGVVVGLLGYAVGNYAGLAMATALRALLGG